MITKRLQLTPRQGGIFVDCYDYNVRTCIKDKKPLIIQVGKETMTLLPNEIKAKQHHLTDEKFKSKFGGQDYKLISFRWKPDQPLTPQEEYNKYLI